MELISKKILEPLQEWVALVHCGSRAVKAQTTHLANYSSFKLQLLSLDLGTCD